MPMHVKIKIHEQGRQYITFNSKYIYIARIVKFVITRLKSNSLPIDYLCIEEEYGILCIIILRVRSD